MLPPDAIGFILFVISTLVAYLLFHFYKYPPNTGSNTHKSPRRSSPTNKTFGSKSSLEKAGKTEQQAPVTGNRSANNVLSSGRYSAPQRQQSDPSIIHSTLKKSNWYFPKGLGSAEQDTFER